MKLSNRRASRFLRLAASGAIALALGSMACSSSDPAFDQTVYPVDSGPGQDAAEGDALGDALQDAKGDAVPQDGPGPQDASKDAADGSEPGDASEAGDVSQEGSQEGGEDGQAGDALDDQTPCEQVPEVCNGFDDNCNGVKDEGDPGGGIACDVPGKLGECAMGTTHCSGGLIKCISNVPAMAEVCDGKDNDCDGQIDNDADDVGDACTTGEPGICAGGTLVCQNAAKICQQNLQASQETCNGLDDDCDGTVDNGFPGAGQPCTVPGQNPNTPCAQGQTNCMGGQNGCSQVVMPAAEVCDGADNDCNGTIDDANAVNGLVCDTKQPGICSTGKTQCNAGVASCIPDVQPGAQAETCNAKDDNCDGTVDNVNNIKLECASKYTSAQNVLDWHCATGNCEVSSCIGAFKDCDGSPNNGCEVNSASDVNQCGQCGKSCVSTNGVASCVNGQCQIACNPGFGNCDGIADNGCEQPLSTDVGNCGSCGKQCESTTGTPSCTNGVCSIVCTMGLGNCDGNPDNGCETTLTTDPAHCGTCTTACSSAGGVASCTAGQCGITCNAGWGNCNTTPTDGCEANLMIDPAHCGSCPNACSGTNGTPTCSAGVCGINCSAGWGNCDNNAANGCETSLNQTTNCGACGSTCVNPNGTTSCSGGTCLPNCASSWGNCDGNPANGCETSLKTLADCGACGNGCDYANAVSSCSTGTCTITACDSGWGNCNGLTPDGCEVNVNTSTANCGSCGNVCSSVNGTASCSAGVCGIGCSTGWGNCDGNISNGCESNLTNSVNHCGACAKACSFAQASASCVNSVCALGACNAGWGNCNGLAADGCEQPLTTTAHCGSCNSTCSLPNATTTCGSGTCAIASCNAGFGNCDGQIANGCETNLLTNPANCGTCGTVCSSASGTPNCVGGVCSIVCSAGWGNCDNNASNGCETQLTTNANCGACAATCTNAHGTTSCVNSVCTPTCLSGWGSCDGIPANGCETALNTTTNCGACGTKCTIANGTGSCTTGTCVISSCNAGFANCNGLVSDGCEASLSATNTCGSCTNACTNAHGTTSCSAGACAPVCASGWSNCDGNLSNGCETSTASSPTNCGACGTVCNSTNGTATCTSGLCGISCSLGWGNCDGLLTNGCEVNTTNNVSNCGGCGQVCSNAHGTTNCVSSTCVPSCVGLWGSCDGIASNGCETALTSLSNCGACNATCNLAHASDTCSTGVCQILACDSGYGNCNALTPDGCETNLLTSVSNCNACGTVCTNAHGSTSCVGGACTPVCTTGYGNCDGNPINGCETSTQTSIYNCGSCGQVCNNTNGTPSCALGSCSITCNAGYGNCDGSASNGCEINLNTNVSHCGNCSTACTNAHGTTSCSAGLCAPVCSTGYRNCDGNLPNGCETYVLTDKYNCGTCGNVCAGTCTNGVCGGTTTNVAPQSTMTISGGGSVSGYEPAQANNNVLETSNCNNYAWIDAGGTPGTAWIQATWSTSKTISSIYIDTRHATIANSCSEIGRTLAGATVQYWNGSTWVNVGTVSGKTNDWSYTFPSPVTTTRLRLYGVYAVGGQGSNPVVYEWQIMGY